MNNKPEIHTTLVSTAALLVEAIQHYGLDFRKIAIEAGIDPDKNYHPNDRLPVRKLQKFWHLAVKYSGDPCFGLTFAHYLQPTALHGLGLAWLASDSLKDGLNRLVRYQRVLSTILDIQLEERPDTYNLIYNEATLCMPLVPASIDATLASLVKLCQLTAGPDFVPNAVLIVHTDCGCHDHFESFFGSEVTFGADKNCILFDKHLIERQLPTAHPELARINDQVVIDYLKHFDRTNITTQVRAQIIEQLPNGLPIQERIAQSLNLSLRNLQRKLKMEGTSYKTIMDETRKELAIQYLKGSERPVIEISFLLGFSDSSNFSRAFRRWTGVSPHDYRHVTH